MGTREKLYYEGKSSLSHIADPHLRIGDEKKPPTKIQHVKYEIWTSSSVLLGARKRLYNDGKSSFSQIALPILGQFCTTSPVGILMGSGAKSLGWNPTFTIPNPDQPC